MPSPRWGRVAALPLLVATLGACRYDPVPQTTIDSLPPDPSTPGPTHRPGEPCLACHSDYHGSTPLLAVGGTVYGKNTALNQILGLPNVLVQIVDSTGTVKKACTNASGNFFIPRENWTDITFPLRCEAGGVTMGSLVGRDGSCATCHQQPSSASLDMTTGLGRASAGIILIDSRATNPAVCGGGDGGMP